MLVEEAQCRDPGQISEAQWVSQMPVEANGACVALIGIHQNSTNALTNGDSEAQCEGVLQFFCGQSHQSVFTSDYATIACANVACVVPILLATNTCSRLHGGIHSWQCVQWKILAQSKQSSFSIADLFSNPTENFNASGNPRLHADRPVSPCNRRWRKPLNQSRKLTCKTQSDMSAQCTCNALKNWFKHNRKTHAAKLSILTLFFLSSFFWCSSCLRRWRNVNLSGHDSCGSSNRT